MVNNVYAKWVPSAATTVTLSLLAEPTGRVYVPQGNVKNIYGVLDYSPAYTIAHDGIILSAMTTSGVAGAPCQHAGNTWYINSANTQTYYTSLVSLQIKASTASTKPGMGLLRITSSTPSDSANISSDLRGWWDQADSAQCNYVFVQQPQLTTNTYSRYSFASYIVNVPQSGITNYRIAGACTRDVAAAAYSGTTVFHFSYNSSSQGSTWLTVNSSTGNTTSSCGITFTCAANNTAAHRAAMIQINFSGSTQKVVIVVNQPGTGETRTDPSLHATLYLQNHGLIINTFGSVYLPKGTTWDTYEIWWRPSQDYIDDGKEPYVAGQKLLSVNLNHLPTTSAASTLTSNNIATYINNFGRTVYAPFSSGGNWYEIMYTGPSSIFSNLGTRDAIALQTVVRGSTASTSPNLQKSWVTHTSLTDGGSGGMSYGYITAPPIPEKITEIWIDDDWEIAADDAGYYTEEDYFYSYNSNSNWGLFLGHYMNGSSDNFNGANKYISSGVDLKYNGVEYELWEETTASGEYSDSIKYGLLPKTLTREALWKMSVEANPDNRICPFAYILNDEKLAYAASDINEEFTLLCVR